jgi:hypothetical protein
VRAALSTALALPLLASAAHAQAGAPLDVSDPTPRTVLVQVETSTNFAIVGQTFGPAFPASYAVSGNIATLTITAETHEQMRDGSFYMAVPGTFSPLVIEIDRTTLEATSEPAYGVLDVGFPISFTQQTLGTTTLGGFVGPGVGPLFCTSQQAIDDACQLWGQFCGLTCTLVPGDAYDPGSGRANLIGIETQTGCHGPCQTFDYFTPQGDLRLTEAVQIPALPGLAPLVLVGWLAAAARVRTR